MVTNMDTLDQSLFANWLPSEVVFESLRVHAMVDPLACAQVLHEYGVVGGLPAGGFRQRLILCVMKADDENRLALSAPFPAIVAAVQLCSHHSGGTAALQRIVAHWQAYSDV